MKFNENTLELLSKSGWSPHYAMDTQSYEKLLKDEGYTVNETVINFLARFGNLEVIHPAYRISAKTDRFHFNPKRAVEHIYRERVEAYENRVQENLVVIGEAYSDHLVLLMSSSGKVFGAYEDYLTCLGHDIVEALETLCEGKETLDV